MKSQRYILLLGMNFIVALIACLLMSSFGFSETLFEKENKDGEVVKGKYFEGFIVYYRPTELTKKYEELPGWSPSRRLVLSVEEVLFKHLEKYAAKNADFDKLIFKHIFEYKLQYWGYADINKEKLRQQNFTHRYEQKILQINFHHNSDVENDFWKVPHGVMGGGYKHFSVSYYLEEKTFTEPSVNCDA